VARKSCQLKPAHEGSAEDGEVLAAEGLDGEGQGLGVVHEDADRVELVDDPGLGAGEVADAEVAVVDRETEALALVS
jgi:hypothetical protein